MARRRYLSTKISNDRAVNDLIAEYGDFAGLLYTWMIPHAEDDATINGDPFYILTEVIPGRRDKTEADVSAAVAGMIALGLLEQLDGTLLGFPTGPFYGYQSYVKQESRRRETAEDTADSGEQRKTPENIVARALPPVTVPPPVSPSPSPPVRENQRADARAEPVRSVPKPKRDYPQNPTWNALSAACGAPDTRDEKADFALTVQQLDEVNATPAEIAGFPPWWRENYGDIRLTHRCYRKHFGGYRNEPPKPPPQISDIKNPRIRAALTTDVSDIYAKHEAERAERNGLPGQMDYPRLPATTRRIGS